MSVLSSIYSNLIMEELKNVETLSEDYLAPYTRRQESGYPW
jgi:hypothetical protein